jgi:hypothetical protein
LAIEPEDAAAEFVEFLSVRALKNRSALVTLQLDGKGESRSAQLIQMMRSLPVLMIRNTKT